jgi:hypothetical protein
VTEHDHSIQESGGLDSINIAAKPKGGKGGDETSPFGRSFISSLRFQFRERGVVRLLYLWLQKWLHRSKRDFRGGELGELRKRF